MIDYTIRFFTLSPLSSLIPLQAQMMQEGYQVQLKGITLLAVRANDSRAIFTIKLTDSTQPTTQNEIADFIAAVTETQAIERDTVLSLLSQTQSIVTIGIPPDLPTNTTLDLIIEIVEELGEGLFHVEGEGFYMDGQLIVEI